MKALFSAIIAVALAVVASTTLRAQAPPTHPTDPNAVLIASYQITISVSGGTAARQQSGATTMTTAAADDECQIKANVNVWRTSTGQIDYVIDAASVVYVGSCGGVDLAVDQVFGDLSREALRTGIERGLSPCTPNCNEPGYSRAYTALCVRRTGTGTTTHFEPCDMTSFCYREYSYCCPNGPLAPDIVEVPRTGDGCGAGTPGVCEPTCAPKTNKLLK